MLQVFRGEGQSAAESNWHESPERSRWEGHSDNALRECAFSRAHGLEGFSLAFKGIKDREQLRDLQKVPNPVG